MYLLFGSEENCCSWRLHYIILCSYSTLLERSVVFDQYLLSSSWVLVDSFGILHQKELFPDNPELSCIISHLVGFMFLVILNCSNSTLVRGIYTDGKESNGECVVFPCHYLRIILEQQNESGEGSNTSAEKTINNLDNVTV